MHLSVIIPVGRPDRVIATLESLERQTFYPKDWEVILVGAETKNLSWFSQVLPLRTVVLEKRENPGTTRNRGAAVASGSRFLFVDDDVELDSTYLKRLAELDSDDVNSAFAGKLPGTAESFASRVVDFANFWSQQSEIAGQRTWFYSAALSVPANKFGEVGGFDEEYHIGEDVDLTQRLLGAGCRLRYEPSLVAKHNHRRDSLLRALRYFVENGKGAPFFVRHAYCVRCFCLKSAVSRAYMDYRTNRNLNEDRLSASPFLPPAIFFAYALMQLSVELNYQRFLLDNSRFESMPIQRKSDALAFRSFEMLDKNRKIRAFGLYLVALATSMFDPVRR